MRSKLYVVVLVSSILAAGCSESPMTMNDAFVAPDAFVGTDAFVAPDTGVCADGDGDGARATSCGGTDCDDTNPDVFPGQTEVCDAANVDDDCDPTTFGVRDADGDGYPSSACCNADGATMHCGSDCDDTRPGVHADAPEVCNGIDDDCDLAIDEGVLRTFHVDADGDGYGCDCATVMMACNPPTGYVESATDCDDSVRGVHPGAAGVCDCTAAATYDADHDGFASDACGGGPDCNDMAAGIHPGVVETCDGVDQDCDGFTDAPLAERCIPCGPRGFSPFTCATSPTVCCTDPSTTYPYCVDPSALYVGGDACMYPSGGTGIAYSCDGPEDCAAGEICCGDANTGTHCATTSCAHALCHSDAECPSGATCTVRATLVRVGAPDFVGCSL